MNKSQNNSQVKPGKHAVALVDCECGCALLVPDRQRCTKEIGAWGLRQMRKMAKKVGRQFALDTCPVCGSKPDLSRPDEMYVSNDRELVQIA